MTKPNSPKPVYDFSSDWFSSQIPNWEKWLEPLRGTPAAALEIGSWEGRSAVWMLDNILVHPSSRLTCVDLFSVPEVESRFDNNIAATGNQDRVVKLKGPSWTHLRSLPPQSFDMVYVDGSHHGRDVLEDAILSYRLTKINGIMVFDDYLWKDDPNHSVYPKDAIDAFLATYQEFVELISMQWQVCIRKIG